MLNVSQVTARTMREHCHFQQVKHRVGLHEASTGASKQC